MGDRSSIARKAALPKQQPQEQLFDTHSEVSLDFEIVRQAASQKYTRPFLICLLYTSDAAAYLI